MFGVGDLTIDIVLTALPMTTIHVGAIHCFVGRSPAPNWRRGLAHSRDQRRQLPSGFHRRDADRIAIVDEKRGK
jgi:hypothetical protein